MSDKFPVVDQEKVQDFIASGANDSRRTEEIKGILAYLHRNADFREAVESGIGREILKESLARLEVLHDEMIEHPLDPMKRVEFDFLRANTLTWSRRIKTYLSQLHKIENNS